MTQFTPECFLEAHRIAFSQFEATRNNVRHVRDSGDLLGASGQLALIDTKALLRRLSYEAADGMHYCVLGELTQAKQFWPTTLAYMHDINARILLVNTAVAALQSLSRNRRLLARLGRLIGRRPRQPPLTEAEISALLASQLDAILLGTRALAETFWYLSKVANQPLLMRRIVAMAGYHDETPLSLQESAEAEQILVKLAEQYKARRSRAADEILAAALKPESLAGEVKRMHVTLIPMWMDQPDQDGAKIVHDVYFPAYYAERLLRPADEPPAQDLAA
jgi:hypothetical protein